MGTPTVEAFGQRRLETNVDSQLPVTMGAAEKIFMLPWFKHFDIPVIDTYINAFRKVISHAGELLEDRNGEAK